MESSQVKLALYRNGNMETFFPKVVELYAEVDCLVKKRVDIYSLHYLKSAFSYLLKVKPSGAHL